MRCEEVQLYLFDYADGGLTEGLRAQVENALVDCPECQAVLEQIRAFQGRAQRWYDVQPPPWLPPATRPSRSAIWQWFPPVASAAALAMATIVWLGQPNAAVQSNGPVIAATAPPTQRPSPQLDTQRTNWQNQQAVDQSLLAESLLEVSRQQREQELAALVRLLKAEMDRRELETQDSLRYVIAHQVQGQQELDALNARIQRISYTPGEVNP